MRQNVTSLLYAPELCADREFVLTVVREDGDTLQFADPALRKDREVVLAAVQQRGDALLWAARELQADRQVVLAAAHEDSDALLHADPKVVDELVANGDLVEFGW